MTGNIAPFAGDTIDDFALWAEEIRQTRLDRVAQPARIRLFDGNWIERGEAVERLDGSGMTLKLNDTGSIVVELPIDREDRRGTYLAHWALDQDARSTTNIHIIVEKDGARIGGRAAPDNGVTLKTGGDHGDRVVLTFLEDTEELKNVHVAANPFLPVSLIQQPKVQFLIGRADWVLPASLAMNLARLQVFNFDMNKDILDPANWLGGMWAQSQIVVKPRPMRNSVAPVTIMTGTIKQSWWEIAAPILEDAELQIVTRRFLKGDPEPWPGAGTSWRQGTLFVELVDKSGFRTGTSLGGNLATGLARSIASVTTNRVEDRYDLLTGAPVDDGKYRLPGKLGTAPEMPYVTYIDGDNSGISGFELVRGAGGACRITAGGESMPGVNELGEAVVGYAGDVLGDNINIAGYGVGSLGSILNAFLMPIYKNSVLAYTSVPLIDRAAQQGWGHALETACTNVTQAYTPAAFMDLRRRRRETDPKTAFTFTVQNAIPWIIGDNGFGHWWLGDRSGATNRYLGAQVHVQRCTELTLPLDGGGDWEAKFGDVRAHQDPLEKAFGLVATAMGAFNQMGVA
ncbi:MULTISPECIES: Gp37-like protein [Gordonia]|uniref:Gp28/Gp37-like domain-containing protein n=1 Tax=Gordonia sihwensis NBRC 108236 TaxID=1223544 RepID=L7LM31_9ACTN|nr:MULTISPECIES: hypothetical protein [Gordonia]AUH68527.1 hypothetical protein CXX93_09380 [Gordonia sp. YC-JH1]GAC62195.1 hypothetical protein GSI01S_30_00030 [Gordonia sihwensis NBRC 108236]